MAGSVASDVFVDEHQLNVEGGLAYDNEYSVIEAGEGDEIVLLDDDGTTVTWRVELEEDGEEEDEQLFLHQFSSNQHEQRYSNRRMLRPTVRAVSPSELLPYQDQTPVLFDVSAYEVVESDSPAQTSGLVEGFPLDFLHGADDELLPSDSQPLQCPGRRGVHSRILQCPPGQASPTFSSQLRPESSLSAHQERVNPTFTSQYYHRQQLHAPPYHSYPLRARRPPTKTAQYDLLVQTEGLDTESCSSCRMRFYLPPSSIRRQMTYSHPRAVYDLPQAFFICPICGSENVIAPSTESFR